MIGLSVTRVIQHEHSWSIGLGEKYSITVECPWRIVANSRIAVADTDQDQLFGLPQPVDVASKVMQVLAGYVIEKVRIEGETSDMHIYFDHQRRLDFYNDSSGYECWQLTAPGGELWVGRNE